MSEAAIEATALRRAEAVGASLGDFIQLMKPGVMSLVVFTALTGMAMAPGHMHPVLAAIALVCIAVGAGAAVRCISASMSASYHMLSAPAAPAPTAMHTNAMAASTGCM